MHKPKNFMLIFIPSAAVFISSFCIMVLELVASRLIASQLGSSLYTWTAVIGVILTGITIGNYLGGRIADKFPAGKTIAVIFAICSVTCVVTIILNNIIGKWEWLWHLGWPLHVFIHVCIVFLIPSTLLGMISPVVAKMALGRGLPTGRTIGDIYAWSAAGSIAGTFAAGYWLIAAMGTITIIWTIGAVLLLMSILYWRNVWLLYVWPIIFIALMNMAMTPAERAQSIASSINLREQTNPNIIYEDESRYYHIAVWQSPDDPNNRFFHLDTLKHGSILMNDILNLQYFYTKIYAAVTEGLSENKKKLCVMAIGGGGYVFPRYIEKVWPGSRIDVVEIDPAVTEAAMRAFGLQRNTTINTFNMDARNYVDILLERKQSGKEIPQYDFIYGDAFNDYSVPFQLVTKEFNDKISAILSDNGVYIINLIDIFDSGLFLGLVLNTLRETFPCVYVVTDIDIPHSMRNTFVIIAAKGKLDIENIISQYQREHLKPRYLDNSDIDNLRQKTMHLVLTDNYCPVENLLAPVVCSGAKTASGANYLKRADELLQKGRFAESIKNYLSAIKDKPVISVYSYSQIGGMYAKMGNLKQAVEAFNKAIQYNNESESKSSVARTRYNLGLILKELGKSEQAAEQFRIASSELQKELAENPTSHVNWTDLGNILGTNGDLKGASDAFKKALELNPKEPDYYYNVVRVLEDQKRYGEAIEVLKKYIELMENNQLYKEASELKTYLKSLEDKNSK
jgi:tetratricopeptide (TPR) repeat protein/MFS family permease